MNVNLDQILSRLNSISRMAIIEDAPNTGKMLVSLSKLIKYRYQSEYTTVIAETEFKFAQIMFEYYNAQIGSMAEFICNMDTKKLSVIFVPHFSLLSFYYCMFYVIEKKENKERFKITTDLVVLDQETQIKIVFTGSFDMLLIYQEAVDFQEDEYVSIKQAMDRLIASGIGKVSMQCETSQLVIHITLTT